MKFKSQVYTQASGSIGGITYSHNAGGMYTRGRSIPTNPNTPAQGLIRGAMGQLVNRWIDNLNILQRAAWNIYAANVSLPGRLGDPIFVSGQNMYVRSNAPRVYFGGAIIDDAPPIFDTGVISPMTLGAPTEAGQTVDVNFNAPDAWNAAGGYGVFYISRPVNPTINYFRGPYRRSVTLADGNLPAVSPLTLTLPFPVVAGQRLFVRAHATYPDARLTQTLYLAPATVAA